MGTKGFLQPIAKDLEKTDPTKRPPISPGPHVAQKISMSLMEVSVFLKPIMQESRLIIIFILTKQQQQGLFTYQEILEM
mgnify:CR=1 FL=1